jgi:RHS repeat-associated protein
MRARLLVALTVPALSLSTSVPLAAPAPPTPPTEAVCGTIQNPCPGIRIIANTFAPVTRSAEAGPFSYTLTVRNQMDIEGFASVTCAPVAQLTCDPTPGSFAIGSGATQVVTINYTTKGLGQFTHQITIENESWDGVTIYERYQYFNSGIITVTGVPIASHMNPLDSASFVATDTMQASFSHSSGVTSSSFRLLIDGADSTFVSGNRVTVTSTGLKAVNLGLTAGYHKFGTYACAVNGRCDSLFTTFNETVSLAGSVLDDSLGLPQGAGLEGLLPGALPLPVDSLRGCPMGIDAPEIRLTNPFSYITQPANYGAGLPAGYIFRAGALWGSTIVISTSTHDYKAVDNKECDLIYTYLTPSQYDWSFWQNGTTTDPLWDTYPYADWSGTHGGGLPPQSIGVFPVGLSAAVATPGVRGAPLVQKSPRKRGGPRDSVGALMEWPGAINPSTYKIWLNDVLIVNNGQPVSGSGVTTVSLDIPGSKWTLPATSALLHHYNGANPSSDNGGWNELIASVADSTNHRSYVRSRFVVGQGNTVQPLGLAPLRDFSHLDQGECAAFGAIQCGGITLTQAIPGFVTRDRDRSLHLVYRSASQRAAQLLPVDLQVMRVQAAPDSLWAWPTASGVIAGGTLRYYGAKRPAGVTEADTLWDDASLEHRVFGVAVDTPITGNVAIRPITVTARSFYPGSVLRDDTLRQEVVYLQLSDTTMTRFGPGWALAEQSRLIFGQTSQSVPAAIWLSGDGSYTIFRQVSGVWVTPPGETARLVDLGGSGSYVVGAKYVLYLDNGASVGFRPSGWQAWTADLVANRTVYGYGGGTDSTRLLTITDPSGIKYELTYGATGTVTGIAIRGTGGSLQTMATLAYDASNRLRRVTIPRNATITDSTLFSYRAGAPGAYIETVTDPRSTTSAPIVTGFAYDDLYFLPVSTTRPPDHFGSGVADYRDPLRRAVARANRGRGTMLAERLIWANWFKGTFVDFTRWPTDFQVDKFGGPTMVRRFAPTTDLLAGDFVRRIARDSVGRVTKIVASADHPEMADSVIYHYDALGRVDTMSRNTVQWPITTFTLDTVTYVYDSVTVDPTGAPGKAWCSRLKSMKDVVGGITNVVYGTSGAGADRCLPQKTIALASDTTIFTYGTLSAGNVWGVRPVRVRDPNGLADSVQYDGATWNSLRHVRIADTATSLAYYNAFGWMDSTLDAVGVRTDLRYDLSGRVIRTRTGPNASTTTPTVANFYGRGGILDSTQIYSSPGIDAAASGTIQTTKNYFDRVGQVDSTLTPGTAQTRRNHHVVRDRWGNPMWDYPGNGAYVVRVPDWQGRASSIALSQVSPSYSTDGQPFADAVTDSVYLSFGLRMGTSLSGGQGYWLDYDNKGRVFHERGDQVFWTVSPFYERQRTFSRANAPISDVLTYGDGLIVKRDFEYNRRGQRTKMTDSLSIATGKGAWATNAETRGVMRYYYNSATARLDSLVDSSGTVRVGRARWLYDRGGRDTLHAVLLAGADADVVTVSRYDAAGRVSLTQTNKPTGTNAGTWYQFSGPTYNKVDELLGFASLEPNGLPAPNPLSRTSTFTYATDGTRRLLSSAKTGTGFGATYSWDYDVFGNRLTENRNIQTETGCGALSTATSTFAIDNSLSRTTGVCSKNNHYYTDHAGNRLAQGDSNSVGGGNIGAQQIMSYTALGQLYFSMTSTAQVGTYDYNWHLYDAGGTRIETVVRSGETYTPGLLPSDTTGTRTFFVYDGTDVALTVVKSAATWWVHQRYLTGGVDAQVAGRFSPAYAWTPQNLVLVGDYQSSTVAAIKADGTQETNAKFWTRSPFGGLEGASGTGGSTNSGTGFTGASTPNSSGGFVYMRNRWYDPQTGRFLTQDPIGLAGGVNLYSYAGNNPVNFSDAFGLQDCEKGASGACKQQIDWATAAKNWLGDRLDDVGRLAKEFFKETAIQLGLLAFTEGEGNVVRVGQILRTGRRVAAVARDGERILTENSHLRGLARAARKEFSRIGSSADEVVSTIAREAAWETTTETTLRGSIRIGSGVVRYNIYQNPASVGEWIVNAWIP